MDTKDWLVPLITTLGAFGGAYYAAHLALGRFYKEKIWERKAAAYTAIFEALHHMKNRYDVLREESAITGSLSEKTRGGDLFEKPKSSFAALRVRLDGDTWLLPTDVRTRIDAFLFEAEHKTAMSDNDLYVFLSESAKNVMADVRSLARADLSVD